jgi:hypothetical protein
MKFPSNDYIYYAALNLASYQLIVGSNNNLFAFQP